MIEPMRFYLGTHVVPWLGQTDVPLFLSYRRLAGRRRLPKALGRWALDSGGFTQLSTQGRWTFAPARYVDDVRRFMSEVGKLDFAACMDWMCEPSIRARTGLSVREHQERTIESYAELRLLAPEVPWMPVLQGWTLGQYIEHVDLYRRAGVDLRALPIVGVGSICRRQHTISAGLVLRLLASEGIKLHALGFKTLGLPGVADVLTSADSLAWSLNARRNPPLPECHHRRCNGCLAYALEWRQAVLDRVARETRRPDLGHAQAG